MSATQDEQPPESMDAQPGPMTPRSASAPVPDLTEHVEEDPEAMVIDYLESLAHLSTDKFGAKRLDTICRSVRHWSADRIRQEITLYLLEILPITPRKERGNKGSDQPDPKITKRRARRMEYALTQKMWKKNRSNCLRTLLRDKKTTDYPPEEVMTPFWEHLMTSECETSPGAGSPTKTYDTRKILAIHLRPENQRMQIRNVTPINNHGVLIRTETKEDMEKIIKSKEIKKAGLTAGLPVRKKPLIIISNIPNQSSDEDTIATIYAQNFKDISKVEF